MSIITDHPDPSTYTILLVDDDPTSLGMLDEYLEDQGFEIMVATDGELALQRAEQGRPDIILLDVLMPGMDGYEVCQALKASAATRDIPVIFITALSNAEDKVKGFSAGGVDYVTKPLQQAEVLVRVRTHLRIHDLTHALQQARDDLERQVEERTVELTRANRELRAEIAERRRMEAEREALIEELETKNTELERFVYTISHDLKSPLITIRGFLGFVEQAALAGDVEQVKVDMARIVAATDKMHQLLGELLEISRIGRTMNPPEEVSLGELAREAVESMKSRPENRDVEVVIAPDLSTADGPTVYGDRVRLTEVWQNLLDNAVKFMGDQPHPRIEIGMRRDNGETVFFVRDNGIGVDPRYQERVFNLFEKLNPNVEGAGVGLTIVKRVVEVHGGRIWVESEGAGQGSAFCFTLGRMVG